MTIPARLHALHRAVVISCQAGPDSPLNSPDMIAALAQSAARGGAAGFRVDGPENVAAVRARSTLPIIGINKQIRAGYDVFITPTLASALAVVGAGADIVALDGTRRERPEGERLGHIIARLHEAGVPVMADIATVEEGVAAHGQGADLVATTLAGYTADSPDRDGPALSIIEPIAATGALVVVEGRIWTVDDVRRCFDAGAFAVVIGSAATVPEFITRRFVAAAASVTV